MTGCPGGDNQHEPATKAGRFWHLHIKVSQADGAPGAPRDVNAALSQAPVKLMRPVLQRLVAHLPAGDGPIEGCLGEALELSQSSM